MAGVVAQVREVVVLPSRITLPLTDTDQLHKHLLPRPQVLIHFVSHFFQ